MVGKFKFKCQILPELGDENWKFWFNREVIFGSFSKRITLTFFQIFIVHQIHSYMFYEFHLFHFQLNSLKYLKIKSKKIAFSNDFQTQQTEF